ncbi:MAG: DNA topoisomerase VI subunit B [Thermoplasmata archaeon]|nr:DNA topoisomerase VI subunit B [Thermoplasmata archaeon]
MSSIAEEMAKKQKEISVAEFFEKNKHILGFDSAPRALITAVKEAVDNSLDACEEAGILPELQIQVEKVDQNDFKVITEDNGPGIIKKQIPNIFARLLYGSRFHSIRQARGQQGIGISAVVMYAQLTTGKPAKIWSKTSNAHAANYLELRLDTKKNQPEILNEDFVIWEKDHGTKLEVQLKGKYIGGKQSIIEYLKGTAIVNPHARITYIPPDDPMIVFERATENMPPTTKEVKPHPEGIELGELISMAKNSHADKMSSFLVEDFSRISNRVAREILDIAKVPQGRKPKEMTLEQAKSILSAIKEVKIMAPETDCLSPIGPSLIKKGLKNVLGDVKADFYAPPMSRDPSVYAGNPFIVEVGIVYGGQLNKQDQVQILRFANRVPLMYQQGACVITKAVESVDWRRYGLEQRGGYGIPYGPAIILVHVASSKIPFTSESKEAIADIEQIKQEIELALKACGRTLKTHLSKVSRREKTRLKFEIVAEILPKIAEKSAKIVRKPIPKLGGTITKIMNIVWVDDKIEFEKKKHKVEINVYNYTPANRSMELIIVLPNNGAKLTKAKPEPVIEKEGQVLLWPIKKLSSTESAKINFELSGLDKDSYDENEIYVTGIDPLYIIGAEPLPGDWDIEKLIMTETPQEEEGAEEEEEEADYDEEGEVLSDEE